MNHTRLYSPAAEHHRALWPVLISRPAEGRRLSWPGSRWSAVSPKALDVDGVVISRYEHTLVAGDLVDRRHFLREGFARDQVDVLILLQPGVRLRYQSAAHKTVGRFH